MVDLHAFARSLERQQREKRHRERSRPWRPSATPATSLGYQCDRRIVYQRTQPELAGKISEELASIFTEGNLHQTDVRRELMDLGLEVVEAEVNFRDERYDITGTIDGKLEVPDENGRHGVTRVPVEIKSTSGDPPKTADAMIAHPGLYGRYAAQMMAYLLLTNTERGVFLFKSKITGLWSVVPFELDYDLGEAILQRAERVKVHVAEGTLPPRLASRSECGGCPFKDTVCHPEEEACDAMLLAKDEELLEQLEERDGLDEKRKRYTVLDKAIKDRFKMTKGDDFVCGPFVITKSKRKDGVTLVKIKKQAEASNV